MKDERSPKVLKAARIDCRPSGPGSPTRRRVLAAAAAGTVAAASLSSRSASARRERAREAKICVTAEQFALEGAAAALVPDTDGRWLAIVDQRDRLQLWDLSNLASPVLEAPIAGVKAATIHLDRLLWIAGGRLRCRSLEAQDAQDRTLAQGVAAPLFVHPGGLWALVGSQGGGLRCIDLQEEEDLPAPALPDDLGELLGMASDGALGAWLWTRLTLLRFQATSGSVDRWWEPEGATILRVSPDGQRVVLSREGALEACSLPSREPLWGADATLAGDPVACEHELLHGAA